MTPSVQTLSLGDRLLLERIRQRILVIGRAHMNDLDVRAAEQVRLLQNLDLVERVGDELRLPPDLSSRSA
jgi:hypothetical protein